MCENQKRNRSFRNWFQHFLWNAAGAEVSILESEECKTDHQKFSAIGATILMTSVIAFFAGTSAAWYFSIHGENGTGNLPMSLFFGLLWALLIFTIDRSLVITLKKNPEKGKFHKVWGPFFFRVILAGLVAFMISIPLELFVFKDYIAIKADEQLIKADSIYRLNVPETRKINDRIAEINVLIASIGKDQERLQNTKDQTKGLISTKIDLSSKLGNPETERYKNAIARITEIEKKLNDKSTTESEKGLLEEERKRNQEIVNEEKNQHDRTINVQINNTKEGISFYDTDINELKETIRQNDSIKEVYEKEKNRLAFTRDSLVNVHIAKYKNSNQFINNYKILATAVTEPGSEYELLFLWLIRSLFFIIEILPTLVKIISEAGNYDWIIFTREESRKLVSQDAQYQKNEMSVLLQKQKIVNQMEISTLEEEQIRNKREQLDKEIIEDAKRQKPVDYEPI